MKTTNAPHPAPPPFARLSVLLASVLLLAANLHGASFTTLHSVTVRWDQDGDHFTPIVSDDSGNLYYAFVNGGNNIVIGKKPPGGSAQSTTITPLRTNVDQYHSTPSIGIDPQGYLHVFGPMHNSAMDYLVSNQPYSVTGGFTRQVESDTALYNGVMRGLWLGNYNSNHRWITYPYVCYDNSYEPWVSYRSRSGNSGWVPGTQNGQLARYNSSTGLWTPIGGNTNSAYTSIPGNPSPKPKCFVWSKYSNLPDNGHQGPSAKPFIDKNGRIHYVFKHERNTGSSSWVQDMLYWYSDDNGSTWRYANGAAITAKPIVVTDGHPAVLWAYGPTGNNDMYGGWGSTRTTDGAKVVSYVRRVNGTGTATMKFAVYANGAWTENNTGQVWFPGRLIIDSNNVWNVLSGRYIYTSTNNGSSWKTYDSGITAANGQNANFDVRYFKKTNKIRYVAKPIGSSGTQTAQIVEFVSDEVSSPASPPSAPSGLTATAASSSQINLAWNDVANETGYKIERKTGSGGTYAQIATTGANVTSYNNTGLAASTSYYYKVRAYNGSGDSTYSNEASATTQSGGGGGSVRIEAGNTASFTDSLGNVWSADQYFTGGTTVDRGAIAIDNTVDDKIYQTERWGMTAYAIPVTNGTYTVRLHMAETSSSITAAGQRVFSVTAEGSTPSGWSNIDLFAECGGKNKARIKTATVVVSDGTLNLAFSASANNPLINGIEVIPGTTRRLEAGNTASFTDLLGNIYSADQYFTGGTIVDRGAIAIANTVDDKIYQTERWGMTAYAIPVVNGTYTVRLHLAETSASITGAGQRVFTVTAEGATPSGWSNMDLYVIGGNTKNVAIIKTATVTVTDGTLNLGFTASANNPLVNGIEVYP